MLGHLLVCVFWQWFVEYPCHAHCGRSGFTPFAAQPSHHAPEHQVVLPCEALLCQDRPVVVPPSYHYWPYLVCQCRMTRGLADCFPYGQNIQTHCSPRGTPLPGCTLHLEFHGAFADTDHSWK